jgi:hypothetical protein
VAVEGEQSKPFGHSSNGTCQGPKPLLPPTEQVTPFLNEGLSTVHQYTMRAD